MCKIVKCLYKRITEVMCKPCNSDDIFCKEVDDVRQAMLLLTDYLNKIAELKQEWRTKNDLLFRGQAAESSLQPKAFAYSEKRELLMFREFKREYVAYTSERNLTDWEILTLAQHHNLPTRLLDWSYNALVALWFAVNSRGQENKEDAIVWIMDANAKLFCNDESEMDFLQNKKTKILRPQAFDSRMIAQSGVFTVHRRKKGDIVDLQYDEPEYRLASYSIKGCEKKLYVRALLSIGFTNASIFPDLDGLASKIKRRFDK